MTPRKRLRVGIDDEPVAARQTHTSTPPLRVGIDLDGTCVDFVGGFAKHYDLDPALWSPAWDGYTGWGMSRHAWGKKFNSAVRKGLFATLVQYEGAADAVQRIAAMHDALYVTARPEAARADTLACLENNGFPTLETVITYDKGDLGLDVLIDDKVENLDDVVEAGGKGYLVDQPWNRNFDRHIRVSSIAIAANFLTGVHR